MFKKIVTIALSISLVASQLVYAGELDPGDTVIATEEPEEPERIPGIIDDGFRLPNSNELRVAADGVVAELPTQYEVSLSDENLIMDQGDSALCGIFASADAMGNATRNNTIAEQPLIYDFYRDRLLDYTTIEKLEDTDVNPNVFPFLHSFRMVDLLSYLTTDPMIVWKDVNDTFGEGRSLYGLLSSDASQQLDMSPYTDPSVKYYVSEINLCNDVETLKRLLYYNNNAVITVDARNAARSAYFPVSTTYNHLVSVIGWDDNRPYQGVNGCFICQNSYGSAHGDEGIYYLPYAAVENYIAVSYEVKQIGTLGHTIFTNIGSSYMNLELKNNADYGTMIQIPSDGTKNTIRYLIDTVGFWSYSGNGVEVELYKNPTIVDNKITDYGTLLTSFASFGQGYMTRKLSNPIGASEGDVIVVRLKVSSDYLIYHDNSDKVSDSTTMDEGKYIGTEVVHNDISGLSFYGGNLLSDKDYAINLFASDSYSIPANSNLKFTQGNSVTVNKGDTIDLNDYISVDEDFDVSFSGYDSSIVSINSQGVVTTKSPGSTQVRIATDDLQLLFTINVTESVSYIKYTLNTKSYEFTGEQITPDLTVKFSGKATRNFTLNTTECVNAGKVNAYITSVNGNVCNIPVPFTITPRDVTGKVEAGGPTCEYNGTELKPTLTITYDGHPVTYTAEYENNVYPGMGLAKATFNGNYTGSATVRFPIEGSTIVDVLTPVVEQGEIYNLYDLYQIHRGYKYSKGFDKLTFSSVTTGTYISSDQVTFSSSQVTPSITMTSSFGNNVTLSATVKQPPFKFATVTGMQNYYEYTGDPIKPNPIVTYDNKTLVAGTDYKLEYKDNVKPGTATLNIIAQNGYTGTKTIKFEITKEPTFVVKDKLDLRKRWEKSYSKYTVRRSKAASVNNKGIVTFKKAGTVEVVGWVKEDGKWYEDYSEFFDVEKPSFLYKTFTANYIGQTISANELVCDTVCVPDSWKSSKASIASVDDDGVITIKKKGTATITAYFGAAKYTFKVTTKLPVLSKKKLTIKEGKSAKLALKNATVAPVWTVEDKDIAYYEDGVVYGMSKGKTVITATLFDTEYRCNVTVK